MTKESLPSSFEKRKLLHSKDTDFDFYARKFIENNRYFDALEFIEKTKNKELLKTVKKVAIEQGDYQLLMQVKKISSEIVEEIDMKNCGENARQLGKDIFADKCKK